MNAVNLFILASCASPAFVAFGARSAPEQVPWTQSYAAGYTDASGAYAGGSEIMHIVPHNGKLFAFNSFWKDGNFGKHSAQVLRLDAPDAQWQVDLETTKTALGYARGNIKHMKGNILKSVTFRTDKNGKPIDVTRLVAASWAFNSNAKRHQAVSFFVRDAATGTWDHSVLLEGPRDIASGAGSPRSIRRVPRDIQVYRDPVTGIDRIFMLVGDPGILSGVFNAETGRIEWDSVPEHPTGGQFLGARPLGLAVANGELYFSAGGEIFRRHNGPRPSWSVVYRVGGRVNTDVGGIRGLTSVPDPNGPGDSLLFVWTPSGRCRGDIKRLDGSPFRETREATLRELFNAVFEEDGATAYFSLGGYNRFFAVRDPQTGETVHLVGCEHRIHTGDAALQWHRFYKGGVFGIRSADATYRTGLINGPWRPSKPILVAPRAFAHSPFPGERNVIYFGGHDANGQDSTDMAWIFKASVDVVLQ